MIIALIMIAYTILCGASFWFIWCNARTSAERHRIIDYVYTVENYNAGLPKLYRKVTYDQHLWARFFFRDPKKLYGDLYPFKETK